jgi:hypothetical protein
MCNVMCVRALHMFVCPTLPFVGVDAHNTLTCELDLCCPPFPHASAASARAPLMSPTVSKSTLVVVRSMYDRSIYDAVACSPLAFATGCHAEYFGFVLSLHPDQHISTKTKLKLLCSV